jgi:hypothetical protein
MVLSRTPPELGLFFFSAQFQLQPLVEPQPSQT